MTYEDAINYLNSIKTECPSTHNEAIDKATDALEKQYADGCVGCKYERKDEYEMPCLICKRNKVDYWQRGDEE